jgi:hypothetical protein
MTIVWIITGLAVILIIVTTIMWRQKQHWLQHKAVMQHIIQLKSLITLLQKHRGMCASFLQGEKKSLEVIRLLGGQIPPIIERLDSQTIIHQQERWQGFTDHWQRLKKHATQLSVESSFEQHTDLITNLLYLLEDIAEKQGFNKSKFTQLPNISLLWRELPFTAEYIGQSRALGMAITTAGVSTQVDKVKLGYLDTKISELSSHVFKQFKSYGLHTPQQTQFIQLADSYCNQLTSLIRNELLATTTVNISPEQYFTTATESIDAINRLLDNELQALSEHLKNHY